MGKPSSRAAKIRNQLAGVFATDIFCATAFAAIVVWASMAPSQAASVCTDSATFQNADGCLDNIFNRTNIAGLDAKPVGDTYYFWFGTDVVLARCIRPGETQVVLFAYHQKNDQACPLLRRVKDAIERGP